MRRSPSIILVLAIAVLGSTPSAEAQAQEKPRRGAVRLEGRALADDSGPFLALGASLFWALWGERHDPERLDRNLAWLAGRGVDYVRVLGMVGAEGWSDRRIDPRDPEYWSTVDRLFARLARHGLRAQVTIFADAQVMMPRRADRQAFVDAWGARAEARRGQIVLVEIANEHRQNGLEDVAELRALGRRLARRTRVLVALSSASTSTACDVYADAGVDVATVHYPRRSEDDPWGPVRQPWNWPAAYEAACRGRLPPAINNEPIGPQSSVETDEDPERLAMAFVTTFVAGNAAYVLHSGAGIRGGGAADMEAGRSADFAAVPGLAPALAGIREARRFLPGDLANWRRRAAHDPAHPFIGFDQAMRSGHLTAAYAAVSRNRFVIAVLGLRRDVTVRARAPMTATVHDPAGREPSRDVSLQAGDRLTLDGPGAFILAGQTAP